MIQRFATVEVNGIKKRIAARGKTEREALMNLAELKAKYEAGEMLPTCRTTFGAWVRQYGEIYKTSVEPGTYRNFVSVVGTVYAPLHRLPMGNITSQHIQPIISQLQGKSAAHINKAVQIGQKVFDSAVQNGLIPANPMTGVVKPLPKEKTPRRALTQPERDLFLKVCPEYPQGILFLVMYYCGLRPAEARALKWSDIKNGELSVSRSCTATGSVTKLKTAAARRTIPIPAALILPKPTSVYVNGTDHPEYGDAMRRHWQHLLNLMDKANGAKVYRNQIIESTIDRDITPYYLRHTYCTRLAENDVNINVAKYLMGHSSITMTSDIYTTVTNNLLEGSFDTIKNL